MIDYFSYLLLNKLKLLKEYSQVSCITANSIRHSAFFVTARKKRL